MTNYDLPKSPPLDAAGDFLPAWRVWLTRTHAAVSASQQSGITADRPDRLLWVGRPYFDTTINKPIWLKSINPIVWVDGIGTPS